MAVGTRSKSLEEQVKKCAQRIAEFAEEFQKQLDNLKGQTAKEWAVEIRQFESKLGAKLEAHAWNLDSKIDAKFTAMLPGTAEIKPLPPENVKKLTAQELQERREKGLCIKCGEKFGFGHQCRMRHLNVMILAEEGPEEEQINSASEESEWDPGILIDASLHAFSQNLRRKAIILKGELGGQSINILVDTGSTDSYVHPQQVQQMALPQKAIAPLSVMVGNGNIETYHNICY